MKQYLFSLALFVLLGTSAKAQCNQHLLLFTTKTNYLNASYQSQGSRDEKVVIDITTDSITIIPNGNQADALTGKIKKVQCDWKVPFKEGKTVIATELVDQSGDTKDFTITIEGKNEKIMLLAEMKERPDQKMQFEVNKFESQSKNKK